MREEKETNKPIFLGLDIETTGSEISQHQLIQIGVARGLHDVFVMDVGHAHADLVIDPEASKVHGFSVERMVAGNRPAVVDDSLCAWLEDRAVSQTRRWAIAIGWNVAGFDMPFVRKFLPKAAGCFSYRTVDLNAICFALDGKHGHAWDWWKKQIKKKIERMLGVVRWHDAGFDAVAGLLAFELLREELAG